MELAVVNSLEITFSCAHFFQAASKNDQMRMLGKFLLSMWNTGMKLDLVTNGMQASSKLAEHAHKNVGTAKMLHERKCFSNLWRIILRHLTVKPARVQVL